MEATCIVAKPFGLEFVSRVRVSSSCLEFVGIVANPFANRDETWKLRGLQQSGWGIRQALNNWRSEHTWKWAASLRPCMSCVCVCVCLSVRLCVRTAVLFVLSATGSHFLGRATTIFFGVKRHGGGQQKTPVGKTSKRVGRVRGKTRSSTVIHETQALNPKP